MENWNIQISDTIADNASGSHFILGEDSKSLNELNPETVSMKLYKNGKLSSEGNGRACMDNPLNATLWLAQKMNNQGEPLCKGEVLLSGAFGPMVSVIKGDDIRMDMDGFASIHLTIN